MIVLFPRVLLASKERRLVIYTIFCEILVVINIFYVHCWKRVLNVFIHGKQKVYLPEEATTNFGAASVLVAFTAGYKTVFEFFCPLTTFITCNEVNPFNHRKN